MSEQNEASGASRRDVLKSGALGVGAFAGVVGVNGLAAPQAAAAPVVNAVPVVNAAAVATNVDNYFLKLDGVAGESTDAKHKGEIQLLSFSWGASNPGAVGSATGGAGAGKVSFSEFNFTATSSKASPLLLLNAASGKHIANGLITGSRKGRSGQEFLKIELEDVLVSSYQQSAGNGSVPVDAASLAFATVSYSYYSQRPDGSLGTPVTAKWDLKANKEA